MSQLLREKVRPNNQYLNQSTLTSLKISSRLKAKGFPKLLWYDPVNCEVCTSLRENHLFAAATPEEAP
ncbi:hypothetical protein L484_009599 [Morus notabilis]|uniref:Uncharacterized protein n=1 Tax=Morus notabilis TaxID=981085 RepID=W9QL90_9ROSA|nr:hypothetical protein L484_009599 [Morus notabilis]